MSQNAADDVTQTVIAMAKNFFVRNERLFQIIDLAAFPDSLKAMQARAELRRSAFKRIGSCGDGADQSRKR